MISTHGSLHINSNSNNVFNSVTNKLFTMAVVEVTEKYFDIVLASNAFQDHFPSNTISHFRAKLPVTLLFPYNVPYRIALHKLSFINAINNFGSGANTKLWISDVSVNPHEIFIPDVSIDEIDVFIAFLLRQLKVAAPTMFPSSDVPPISIHRIPNVIRTIRSVSNNSNEMLADQGGETEDRMQVNIEMQETYSKLTNIRDTLCRILFNFSQEPCDMYMRFAAFVRHELNNITNLLSSALDHEVLWEQYKSIRIFQKPYPHLFLKQFMNWILLCYSTYIEPYLTDSAFSKTEESEERALDFVLHIQDQLKRTYFIRHPELKKQFHQEQKKVIDNDQYRIFFSPFQAFINLETSFEFASEVDIEAKLIRDKTLEKLNDVCISRISSLNAQIDSLTIAIETLWPNPPSTEVMIQMIEDYVRLLNWRYFATSKHFPNIFISKRREAEIRRPRELIVINPATNTAFTTIREYQIFMLHLNQNSRVNDEPADAVYARISNQAVQAYARKRKLGLITKDTPINELTGDEVHFFKQEFIFKTFNLHTVPEFPNQLQSLSQTLEPKPPEESKTPKPPESKTPKRSQTLKLQLRPQTPSKPSQQQSSSQIPATPSQQQPVQPSKNQKPQEPVEEIQKPFALPLTAEKSQEPKVQQSTSEKTREPEIQQPLALPLTAEKQQSQKRKSSTNDEPLPKVKRAEMSASEQNAWLSRINFRLPSLPIYDSGPEKQIETSALPTSVFLFDDEMHKGVELFAESNFIKKLNPSEPQRVDEIEKPVIISKTPDIYYEKAATEWEKLLASQKITSLADNNIIFLFFYPLFVSSQARM